MARCHRIGQKKQVTIYRLITRRYVRTLPLLSTSLALSSHNPFLPFPSSFLTSYPPKMSHSLPILSLSNPSSHPFRSFEAEMFDRASKKLGLEQAVLGTRQFNDTDVRLPDCLPCYHYHLLSVLLCDL